MPNRRLNGVITLEFLRSAPPFDTQQEITFCSGSEIFWLFWWRETASFIIAGAAAAQSTCVQGGKRARDALETRAETTYCICFKGELRVCLSLEIRWSDGARATKRMEGRRLVHKGKSSFLSCACILFLLCFAEPSSSSSSTVPFGRRVQKQSNAERQPFPIDNQSLFVDISNNMAATTTTDSNSVINVDCVALSSSREPLDFLGYGPVSPSTAVIYYMNLNVFTPNIVSCTFEWSGKKKTLDMYDDRNFELQYKYVRWSVMENGFSLYHPVSEQFHLYETWT